MALYQENFPFVNAHGLNLDWILKKIKETEDRVEALETDYTRLVERMNANDADNELLHRELDNITLRLVNDEEIISGLTNSVTTITNNITTINNAITEIQEELEGIDLQALEDLVNSNNIASINRDNALSARIANLERATLHDIYNYYSESNQLLFGSDLRHMSPVLDSDGYPIVAWGNKTNASQAGTPETRGFKFVEGGMVADTSRTSYDYYQVGKFTNGLGINGAYTVTLALVNADDATPTWYKHTFTAANEAWNIATNCVIRMRKFYNWNNEATNHIMTVAFMGTSANWSTFLGNSKISFIFIENGTGSVDTSVTAKPEYNMKDREFFVETETPTPIIEERFISGNGTATAVINYYDLVGDVQTLNAEVTASVFAKKYGKVVDGYINIHIDLANNLGDKLARGMNFTITGLAMTYEGGVNLPLPNENSALRGVANDSKYYEWGYNNTQNTYAFVNISNNGTWNIKSISSGMQNYTGGEPTTYTDLRVPLHYIA